MIAGATGLVGRALVSKLARERQELVVLARDAQRARGVLGGPCEVIQWDGGAPLSPPTFEGVEAVVNLAGEPIAEGRWTQERKGRIRDSRVFSTRRLVEAIAKLPRERRPRALVSASAVGIYGGLESAAPVGESAAAGQGFLAEVCRDWESEALRAEKLGLRVVCARIGVVLSRQGGALAKMLPLFRSGLGGVVGAGSQYMSWVHIDDLTKLLLFAVGDERMSGAFNATAPDPVTNAIFARELARVLGRRAAFAVPAAALRIALGEQANVVLEGQRVLPEKALGLGFEFAFPELTVALHDLLSDGPQDEEFVAEQFISRPIDEVFDFFSRTSNLEAITPPWLNFEVIGQTTEQLEENTRIDYKLKIHGWPVRWQSRIEQWSPRKGFVDAQMRGPYASWRHAHRFVPVTGGTLISDRVLYRVPLGCLGAATVGGIVRRDVERIFAFRRAKIEEVFHS